MPKAGTQSLRRSLPSWHQEQVSCSASSFPNATSSFSSQKKTQKSKCLAGSISSEKVSSEQKGVPPAQGCLPQAPQQENAPFSEKDLDPDPDCTDPDPPCHSAAFFLSFIPLEGDEMCLQIIPPLMETSGLIRSVTPQQSASA